MFDYLLAYCATRALAKEVSMRPRPGFAVALLAVLAVGLAAGCGSSKKSSGSAKSTSTSAPAITKAQFLKEGNAICNRGNREIGGAAGRLFPKSGGRPSQAKLTEFARTVIIPSVQRQIDEIKALGAPAGDRARVSAIVGAAQAALDKGKRDPALLTTNGPGPFKKANQLAKSYGLTACAAGS